MSATPDSDDVVQDLVRAGALEPDAIVVGYALIAAYKTPEMDDVTGYWHSYANNQPHHVCIGLLHYALDKQRGIESDL